MLVSQLTPAEVLLLLDGRDFSVPESMKTTFLDLLLKQVLQTTEITRQSHRKDPPRTHIYAMLGKQYSGYNADAHEMVFIEPFSQDSQKKILLSNLIKLAYENVGNNQSYQLKITKAKGSEKFYKRSFTQYFTNTFSLTSSGNEARNTLRKEITFMETTIPKIFPADESKALRILKEVKGNIFLLKNTKFSFVEKLEKEILKGSENTENFHPANSAFPIYWSSFDSYSHTFNTSCSTGCSSGDSGCSGDTGCSGCGGGD
jgi:hypothetical protein